MPFAFLAPWFLAGLAAIGVPVMVHMIQKERKEVLRFPSLMFLSRIPYQAVRRQKVRHWFLLVLRCLAIILLAIAFSRPFFLKKGGLAGTAMKMGRDVVILLDRSYSMEYGSRWRRAQAAAKDAVDKLGSNDRAVVVYFGGTATMVGTGLTNDKRALLKAIDTTKPTADFTRYDVAFRAAQRIFGDTARPRREVVLVSDGQRAGWGGRELPPLPVGTTFTQANLSDSVTSNVFVTRADVRYIDNDTSGREHVVVAARLANRSDRPAMNHLVKLEVNGRQLQAKPVNVPANGTADVEFADMPIPPGLSRGVIQADADSLQRDNLYYFVLARKAPTPVLVVEAPSADTMAGLFLTRALSIGDRPTFQVKTVRPDQISAELLKERKLVVLNDVPVPGGTAGQLLTDFVKHGGGLLVTLGSHSDPGQWPSLANELMPRPSGSPIDRVAERGEILGFLDRGHPVFEAFNAPRSGDFSSARFYRYWPVTAGQNDRQLARYGDSRPALVERRVGAGRVLLWSSDLDGLWNDVPLQPVFLPFIRQAATYASGYKDDRLAATVGQAVSPAVLFGDDAPPTDSVAAKEIASRQAQYVAITPSGKQGRFGVPGGLVTLELAEQGFYELKRTSGSAVETRLLPVNVDLTESDLAPLDAGVLEVAVAPRTAGEQAKVAPLSPRDVERRQGVWWYLVVIALLLFGVETLLSNRLSRALR